MPVVPGYSWAEHPNTLLLAYPAEDCGCGVGPRAMIDDGLKMGMDILIISSSLSSQLKDLQKSSYPSSHFKIVTNVDTRTVRRFILNDKQGGFARIKNGQLTDQFYDGTLLKNFK